MHKLQSQNITKLILGNSDVGHLPSPPTALRNATQLANDQVTDVLCNCKKQQAKQASCPES